MNTTSQAGYSTPRDTFLYLLALITLIASSISFGLLVYQFIDLKFPDVLNGVYSTAGNLSSIRTALSALVVVFPVFFWVSRVLHKDVVAEPEKRSMRIRRWLMYFTVFVAGLVVIGDLVALIYNFLNGALTTAFILKVLTILFIAGSSLFYYLAELRDRKYPRGLFQIVVIAVVVIAAVYGFAVAGSPQSQRQARLDDQKIQDLQSIQSYLVFNYWEQKGSLPASLSQLNDPISNFTVPQDPQTKAAYEYHVTSARSFQLCAVFNQPSSDASNYPRMAPVPAGSNAVSNNWDHGAGRVCFDRTIDPSLYPVQTK